MDGVDDRLEVSGATVNNLTEFEFDFVIDAREDWHQIVNFGGKLINFSSNTLNININAEYQSVYVDRVQVTSGTPFLNIGQRHVMKGLLKTNTGTSGSLFFTNSVSQFLKGKIYSLKLYKQDSLVAHYDMSTGTVQDQSGNGNHATLNGGTWADDGTGEEPIGTDGEITLSLSQQIYNDNSANLNLTQSIYSDSFAALNLRQEIYQDIEASISLIQTIYKDDIALLNLSQTIYRDSLLDLATRQEIYSDNESVLSLIQEFYQDGFSSSTLNLIQEIYHDSSTDLPMRQEIYQDGELLLNLVQQSYNGLETILSLNQSIYRENSAELALIQTIYRDAVSNLNLVQQMYSEGEVGLPLLIQIRDDLLNVIGSILLKGSVELYVNLKAKQELFVRLKGGVNMAELNQNFSMFAGDSKYLTVSVDGVTDFTGADIKWVLKNSVNSSENVLLKTTSSGISIVNGMIQIKLDPADTEAIRGAYYQECELTDSANNVSTIFTGFATVKTGGV